MGLFGRRQSKKPEHVDNHGKPTLVQTGGDTTSLGLEEVLEALSNDLVKARDKTAREEGRYGLGVSEAVVHLAVTVSHGLGKDASGGVKWHVISLGGGFRIEDSSNEVHHITLTLNPVPPDQPPGEQGSRTPYAAYTPSARPPLTTPPGTYYASEGRKVVGAPVGVYAPGIYAPGVYDPGVYGPGVYDRGVYGPFVGMRMRDIGSGEGAEERQAGSSERVAKPETGTT